MVTTNEARVVLEKTRFANPSNPRIREFGRRVYSRAFVTNVIVEFFVVRILGIGIIAFTPVFVLSDPANVSVHAGFLPRDR